MADYSKGILGSFSGTVGPVVGSTWRGKNVMRSLPKKGKRIASPAQAEQREKFKLVNQFLGSIKEGVNRYFDQPRNLHSRLNKATSYHLAEAIEGTPGDYKINYSKVLFSKGSLYGFRTVECYAIGGGVVRFTYDGGSEQSNAKNTDELIVLVYDPEMKGAHYETHFASRADHEAEIVLNANWLGKPLHIWLAMTDLTGKECSTSTYLGEIILD